METTMPFAFHTPKLVDLQVSFLGDRNEGEMCFTVLNAPPTCKQSDLRVKQAVHAHRLYLRLFLQSLRNLCS